jgi:hypothetical protein
VILHTSSALLRKTAALALLGLLAVPNGFSWGSDGHRMINRLAAESLPADAPAFLKTPQALDEIEYLGPEPDRWRSPAEPELSYAQAPEHFIDLETADVVGPLPRRRSDFLNDLAAYRAAHPDKAAVETPEKVGLQPWETNEVWERLKAAFREYRQLTAAHANTRPVEAAILFYSGWLGHYVGDGSQPLHVSIQYNGWTGPNPNGYTTEHHIHSQFESEYVAANIKAADVRPLIGPVRPIEDEWVDYLAYLRHTGTLVETTYQLEKAGGFTAAGTPAARQFTEERLAAGAAMLRDMIYAAWVESAKPVPDPHAASSPALWGPGAEQHFPRAQLAS